MELRMIFEKLADGTPAPRLPVHKGQPLTPDGRRFFDITQAVHEFQRSDDDLRDLYRRTFEDLFEDVADNKVGSIVCDPSKLDAARVSYLRVDKFSHLGDEHFNTVLAECRAWNLDIGRHVWAEVGVENGRLALKIIVKVDAFRLIAQRSGEYAGQTEAKYLDTNGQWHKVWMNETQPLAARIGVRRVGFEKPIYRTARWKAYAQYTDTARGPVLNEIWEKMGPEMLAKCAEALALRTAFPQELAGLYAAEEMMQAKNSRGGCAGIKPSQRNDIAGDDCDIVIDENTPETQAEFDTMLASLGFNTPESRRGIVSQLKQKFSGDYCSQRSFFALAIRWLKRSAA